MTIYHNMPILQGRGSANETESEYQRVLAIVELLMNKQATSLEEMRLLDLFVILVEKFESEHYPSPNLSTPHSRLLHLMEANQLQPVDLIGVFGSRDIATEIIEGKRPILQRRGFANDKTHAEKLSDRFNLPATIFLT
jgi:HTH-type transcriptional regulator / antitoxin HigA